MNYRCLACKYKFKPKTDRVPNKCPFCSSPNIRRDETAQDILNDLDRIEPRPQ